MSTSFLALSAHKQITCYNQTLDLEGCETLDAAAVRAVLNGWIAYLDHRGVVTGLRLIPRIDGVQTRLRAPLANIFAMYAPDKRDEQIAQLESDKEHLAYSNREYCEMNARLSNKIVEHETMRKNLDQQWQDATGANDPEMARELTAQRIEQIKALTAERDAAASAAKAGFTAIVNDRREMSTDEAEAQRRSFAFGNANISNPDITRETIDRAAESMPDTQGVGRMVWPDPDNAPEVIKCANAIVAHRRGEFVELAFPSTPKIFEQVRAWLMYYQMNICARVPDETGYATNAIGTNGEIPPKWSTMKQAKRNSYPGFVLFAPDNSAKVVFRAKEPSIGKVGKRKAREPKS